MFAERGGVYMSTRERRISTLYRSNPLVATPWWQSLKTTVALILLLLAAPIFTSCSEHESSESSLSESATMVSLSLRTMSITSTYEGYEAGTTWENYVDFANEDYHIYFFTYDPSSESTNGANSTLIAEFMPTTIYSSDRDTYTTYTLAGEVDADLIESLTNFKVVVVANWGEGHYPEVVAGVTTIDDICNAETAVFNAFVSSGEATMPSSSFHIPFFGLREYSGVTWRKGIMTRLSGDITLLRSVAKVEVILEDADVTFTDININNYNATGYCAPTSVYLRDDYDHSHTWADDFVEGLHLVDGANDTGEKSFSFHKAQEMEVDETTGEVTQYETWVAYVPEYNNMGDDFSYISVMTDFLLGNEPYKIYFANYSDGGTTAYGENEASDMSDRYDIYRNNLYRFFVSMGEYGLLVSVNEWDDAFDNEWTFGDMDIGEVLGDGERFLIDNYWEYVVIDSANLEVAMTYNTSEEGNVTNYSGSIEIPETVYYNGVYYRVTAIDEECFYNGTGIASVIIPTTVSEIGNEAFSGCTGLETITCLATTPPDCGDNVFYNVPTEECILRVPEESLSIYESTEPWSSFTNIYAIED